MQDKREDSPLPGQKALPGLESAEDERGQERRTEVKGKRRKKTLGTENRGKKRRKTRFTAKTLRALPGQKTLPGLKSAEDERGQERRTEVKGKRKKKDIGRACLPVGRDIRR